MTVAAFELNDAGLLLRWAQGGSEPSPACALLEDGALVHGPAASAKSRLLPRHVHDRFWAELDTGPLPPPFPPELSAADLVHEHLQQVLAASGAEPHSLILAVPGSFTKAQLGLLLGIARTLPARTRGLVDAAVAAAHGAGASRDCVHVDLELHRAVVTELHVDDRVSRGRVTVLEGAGLASLRSLAARHVASLFVEGTRFDPLSSAAAEQQLHGLLPALTRELATDGSATVELETGSGNRSVEVDGAGLARRSGDLVETILAAVRTLRDAGSAVLVSDRASSLPGLHRALGEATGEEPDVLPADAGAAGALAARAHLESDGEALPFVLDLPLRGDDGAA